MYSSGRDMGTVGYEQGRTEEAFTQVEGESGGRGGPDAEGVETSRTGHRGNRYRNEEPREVTRGKDDV